MGPYWIQDRPGINHVGKKAQHTCLHKYMAVYIRPRTQSSTRILHAQGGREALGSRVVTMAEEIFQQAGWKGFRVVDPSEVEA